ncbi:16S rRNA (cytosine967-C5)-methyltransferase [Salimicrobium salexigens]|uniref:16S rRNA (cytosine(967)-C(5))-methyltransferase n=2 Tax=Salimicrobium salexigens TaxID=908941 RepID=A0ABY1KQ34_9BACI|nr:16S rRNA (cytosine967-C5)-methyltransferase [Salimicrobium salexigens]
MKTMSNTVRESALYLLTRVGEEGGFSHVLVNREIENGQFSSQDAGLLTELVYGTLQHRDLLDYWLEPFMKKQKKITPWVKWLLYMSVYQMEMLDRIPDHAVLNEAVSISKRKGHKGTASFTNAVLRSVQREGVRSADEIEDSAERLAIRTSHPYWLVNRWIDQYGYETTESMCMTNQLRMPESIRVQPLLLSRAEAVTELERDGFEVEESRFSSQGIIVHEGNIIKHRLFREGLVTIQDQSSMLVAELMNPEPGQTVLDACAAPGGKTTHISEKMKNEGTVYAYDLHKKKAGLIREKANILRLTNIHAENYDARKLQDKHNNETFDHVLVDAPCSGFGVIRSKPDIKYSKKEEDIYRLREVQDHILDHVVPLLKENGLLVYSTCTVDRHENDEAVRDFLKRHPAFETEDFGDKVPEDLQHRVVSRVGLQIFPQDADSDGFFVTLLRKKSK